MSAIGAQSGHAAVTVIGIRHHSPACARVVADTIEHLRPTDVLIEGPADFSARLGELTLDHTLPIALFSHVREGTRTRVTWTAFVEWSPEWVALQAASRIGADVKFIDLPTWHPEFASTPDEYGPIAIELAGRLGLDTVDAMWDHVVEAHAGSLTTTETKDLLDDYFDTIRTGDTSATARERYMASWVKAAAAQTGSGAIVVVCGGRHRPMIMSEITSGTPSDGSWPTVPTAEPALDVGSYLVPYSYRRMTLESPWWYRTLWEDDTSAAEVAAHAIVRGLRTQRLQVSTTDFLAFRTQITGIAAMRGHSAPTRRDILDAAASTLVTEALTSRLPWTLAGEPFGPEPDPVVASCLRTMRGDRRGRLHPDSPAPGLVHHVDMLIEEYELEPGTVTLELADHRARARSRVLHQLRLLGIPGFERTAGPGTSSDTISAEQWLISHSDNRIPALVEAAAQGHTLVEAAGVALDASLVTAGPDVSAVAGILFGAVLGGLDSATDRTASAAVESVTVSVDLAATGVLLQTALDLWRHDSLFGSEGSTLLGAVVSSASIRVIELARRVRATASGADLTRIAAVAALADAMQYAEHLVTGDPVRELTALARDDGAAPDMRGSALGATWNRTTPDQSATATQSIPIDQLGDWLCGLFGVAREQFLDHDSSAAVLSAVDDVVASLAEHEFLTALPALREAFEFFPPRERGRIADRLIPESTVAASVDSADTGRQLDTMVDAILVQIGLQ